MRMPTSGGGLVRYFDEYKSRIQIKPTVVIILIIIIIAFEVLIRAVS